MASITYSNIYTKKDYKYAQKIFQLDRGDGANVETVFCDSVIQQRPLGITLGGKERAKLCHNLSFFRDRADDALPAYTVQMVEVEEFFHLCRSPCGYYYFSFLGHIFKSIFCLNIIKHPCRS